MYGGEESKAFSPSYPPQSSETGGPVCTHMNPSGPRPHHPDDTANALAGLSIYKGKHSGYDSSQASAMGPPSSHAPNSIHRIGEYPSQGLPYLASPIGGTLPGQPYPPSPDISTLQSSHPYGLPVPPYPDHLTKFKSDTDSLLSGNPYGLSEAPYTGNHIPTAQPAVNPPDNLHADDGRPKEFSHHPSYISGPPPHPEGYPPPPHSERYPPPLSHSEKYPQSPSRSEGYPPPLSHSERYTPPPSHSEGYPPLSSSYPSGAAESSSSIPSYPLAPLTEFEGHEGGSKDKPKKGSNSATSEHDVVNVGYPPDALARGFHPNPSAPPFSSQQDFSAPMGYFPQHAKNESVVASPGHGSSQGKMDGFNSEHQRCGYPAPGGLHQPDGIPLPDQGGSEETTERGFKHGQHGQQAYGYAQPGHDQHGYGQHGYPPSAYPSHGFAPNYPPAYSPYGYPPQAYPNHGGHSVPGYLSPFAYPGHGGHGGHGGHVPALYGAYGHHPVHGTGHYVGGHYKQHKGGHKKYKHKKLKGHKGYSHYYQESHGHHGKPKHGKKKH